jgi:predicted kinase
LTLLDPIKKMGEVHEDYIDPHVLCERITECQARGTDASEATVEVLEKQLDWLEPLDTSERAQLV